MMNGRTEGCGSALPRQELQVPAVPSTPRLQTQMRLANQKRQVNRAGSLWRLEKLSSSVMSFPQCALRGVLRPPLQLTLLEWVLQLLALGEPQAAQMCTLLRSLWSLLLRVDHSGPPGL